MVYTILVVVQVVVALSLVGLILVQHGKGADAGAAFGSGASGTVFGAKGSANFMSRATAALATVFFVASLSLAYLVNGASTGGGTGSVTDQLSGPATNPSAVEQGVGSTEAQAKQDAAEIPADEPDQANKQAAPSATGKASSDDSDGPKIPD